MKARRGKTEASILVVASALVAVVVANAPEPVSPRTEYVATSSSASTHHATAFETALHVASDPRRQDHALVQPLVGPLRSVKAPNLRQNTAALNAKAKNAAASAYDAAKSAAPGVLSVAKDFATHAVKGAGFVLGGHLMNKFGRFF